MATRRRVRTFDRRRPAFGVDVTVWMGVRPPARQRRFCIFSYYLSPSSQRILWPVTAGPRSAVFTPWSSACRTWVLHDSGAGPRFAQRRLTKSLTESPVSRAINDTISRWKDKPTRLPPAHYLSAVLLVAWKGAGRVLAPPIATG
jgi:hypothetical protein